MNEDNTVTVKILPAKHEFVIGVITLVGTIAINKLVRKGHSSLYEKSENTDSTED